MNTENQVREMRRAYQAPVMTLVQLRPEEAVLSACKVTTSSGPEFSNCVSGLGVPCNVTTGS